MEKLQGKERLMHERAQREKFHAHLDANPSRHTDLSRGITEGILSAAAELTSVTSVCASI